MTSINGVRLRSVDFLTPEQLKRKRETDRKSQREIRSRTKAHIESLELKVAELEKQKRILEEEKAVWQSQCICNEEVTNITREFPPPQQVSSGTANLSNGWEQFVSPDTPFPDASLTHTSLESLSWQHIIEYATINPSNSLENDMYSPYSTVSPGSDQCLLSAPTPSVCTQVWSALPNLLPPMCPLDEVLIDLVKKRRAYEEGGGNVQEFQKRQFPSVQSLLNPEREQEKSPVTSAIVKRIIHVMVMPNLPEQIATLYVMSSIVRWQISPTPENYDALPQWLRPTAAQIVNAHPAWINVFPWPRARERVARYPEYHKENGRFQVICNATLSINWPYTVSDMLVQISETDSILNPIFERHIRDLSNWTVGQAFVDAFPAFVNDVNVGPARRD